MTQFDPDADDETAYYMALGELSYLFMLMMKELNPSIKDSASIDLIQGFLIDLESTGVDEEKAREFGKAILQTAKRMDEDEQMH